MGISKKIAKKLIYAFSFIVPVKTFFIDRRYHTLEFSTFLVNLITQRLFRVNGKANWMVHFTSRIISPHKIKISKGEKSYSAYLSFATSGACYFQAGNGIHIGEGVIWGYGIKIVSANHSIEDYSRWKPAKAVEIGNYTWLGSNTVVLPGVLLGDYVIVGAGAIVTKSFPSYAIIAGNPAKIIAFRCKKCLAKLDQENQKLHCYKCKLEYGLDEYDILLHKADVQYKT